MPRIARMVVKGEPAVYHVRSRTALDGYVIGDIEKDFLLKLIRQISAIYFVEVFGFCLMGNHFHLLVMIYPGESTRNGDRQVMLRPGNRFGAETGKQKG
ncbi:conserved hypothetical protein [uncultured Desulfobacterium sp.]|uniref:Transposase IS200-like domain-containing protein n=1 Tax=uncultured Desulfobacterium sp. TaxID=201089 RepID=A0A445MZX2_9BACT|nr:conserved hypothetical protein [uncultured Desulfobacterium sp.]